jgi:NAD(P)-dependent dehydrogenase (short-subunit alcohol dehydrogenase family)
MSRFTNKTVVITGAARGIGAVIAADCVSEGCRVAILDMDGPAARKKAESLGEGHIGLEVDVTDATAVRRAYKEIDGTFGGLDFLVNCAGGYSRNIKTLELTEADYDLVLDSNLKGTFLCCQEALRRMVTQGRGAIVNFSSLAGRATSPALGAHYTAAKAGVLGLTRHLAKEFGPLGIRVNAIAPGTTEGERVDQILTAEDRAQQISGIPLGRLAAAADLSPVVRFLLSEDAGYITGATIDVNGGVLMM